MRLMDLINEGGWDSTATQKTVIRPSTVKKANQVLQQFVHQFNQYLAQKNIGPVSVGQLTGSSHWHFIDPEETIYGDIDQQIIVPEIPELEGKTMAQHQAFWANIEDEFVKHNRLSYIHPESDPGHPIFDVGNGEWVQVDLMPHVQKMAPWGAARTIPERGIKGLLHGNMFSVLGDLLTLSIQHSGVQYKDRNGQRQPYATTRKDYTLQTISINPETFVMDIFKHEAQQQGVQHPKMDVLLQKHPGKNIQDVKVSNLVNAIKGLARSFELNGMFGKGHLTAYANANDFLTQFLDRYTMKAEKDIAANKRDKAETPEAKARAEQDKQKIASGLKMVQGLFAS
jgi:hypothetical protein